MAELVTPGGIVLPDWEAKFPEKINLKANTQELKSSPLLPHYTIYVKPNAAQMTQRKLEGYQKLCEIKSWGQKNPTKFIKQFFGIELLDAQEYLFMNAWTKPFALWLCSRAAGKSTLLALFSMTKGMLFDNYRIYICSGTADQSIETFRKIEDIALKNIDTFTGLTDVFKNEVEVSNVGGNGFIHNPMGFTYNLYNGAFVKTLNSNINAKRGKRCECVTFDEGGWLSEEDFNVIGAFTALDSSFKLGGGKNPLAMPKEFPHQLLYASSASAVDTAFWNKYRDFSKRMIYGDNRYFVADINCDVVINATFHGKLYGTPLLNRENVENELRNNPEKAMREYYNQFTQDAGEGQIIRRAVIARNSFSRRPVLFNDTSKRKFCICFDPARDADNCIVGIGELINDEEKGWMMDIVNVVNIIDVTTRKKRPKTDQEQIAVIKELLADYNGNEALDWENIEYFCIDAGAGGGGNRMPEKFCESWFDPRNKKKHRGMVDPDYDPDLAKKYPDADKKTLRLLEPTKYKSEMFEVLIKLVEADLIHFTEKYDNKGYINVMNVDPRVFQKLKEEIEFELSKMELTEDEYALEFEERMTKHNIGKTSVEKLSLEEECALGQIDAMKEEIVNIVRTKRESGKDSFNLPKHKDASLGAGVMHDDRAYVLAMLGWCLGEIRRDPVVNKKREVDNDLIAKVGQRMRQPKRVKMFGR